MYPLAGAFLSATLLQLSRRQSAAIGFALDICLKIVDAVKKEFGVSDIAVDYLPVTSSNRIPLMVNGTIDLHCAGINTIDDLKGKSVTAVAGSVHLTQLIKVNTAAECVRPSELKLRA